MFLSFGSCCICSNLSSIRSRFSRTFEPFCTSRWPCNYISTIISYWNYCIIKSSIYISYTSSNIFFNFFFIILGFSIISGFLVIDTFSFFSLSVIYYFFIGVNFFPAIAIALPFLVLALECVRCPLTGNFFLCLDPL